MQPPGVEPEPPRFEPKPAFGDARMPPPPPAVGKQKPAAPPVASTSAPSSATDISNVSKNSNQNQSHQLLQREVFLCEGKIVFPKKSTTVFVGKIPETLDAQGVNGLLNCCGRVKSWKRASHFETEKPKHFGFVEYYDALSCIKAVRVLNALQVDKSQLMAKGNQATIKYMEEFMKYFRTEAEASDDDKYECTGVRKEIAEFLEKRESKDAADAFFQTLGGAGGAAISTGEDSSPGRQHDAGAGKKGKASSSASKPSGADERRLRRSDQQLYERSLKQFEIDEERRRNSKRRSLEREESYARERLALIEREEERAGERGQEASHGDGASKIFRQHLKGMLNSGGGSTLADSDDHHSNSRRGGSSSFQNRKEAKERRLKRKREIEEDGLDRQLEEREKEEEAQRQISVTVKSVSKVRKNISSVFGADEESGEQPKGLDIMAQIPVEKEVVFAYPIDWKLFPLVSSSVEKWVLQKTVELLGEEEHSLKEFVMKKLSKDTVFLDVGRGVGGGVGAGAAVAAASAEGQEDDLPSLPQLECASGCKRIFIGDNHCDKECFNAECEWDGGDCEKSCELRRLVVMGPYYKEVDHVEFQCVGPAGQMQAVPFEEGLKWEGITPPGASDEDEEEDWRKALSDL